MYLRYQYKGRKLFLFSTYKYCGDKYKDNEKDGKTQTWKSELAGSEKMQGC